MRHVVIGLNYYLRLEENPSAKADVHTLKLTPISSFYPQYFKKNMNKTCVRSKDNLNSVGYMPMLAGIVKNNQGKPN